VIFFEQQLFYHIQDVDIISLFVFAQVVMQSLGLAALFVERPVD